MRSIGSVQAWLEGAYQEHLGVRLQNGLEPAPGRPCWSLVDADLRPVLRTAGQGDPADATRDGTLAQVPAGGVVLDADIGLCLYIMAFGAETGLETQVARALAIGSRLLPRSPVVAPDPGETGDPCGGWSVAIHWLVEAAQERRWQAQAAQLRTDTTHLEEVPIDCVILPASDLRGGLGAALDHHGFPRLLLATRALFERSAAAVERWANADYLAWDAIRQVLDAIRDPAAQEPAAAFAAWLAAADPASGDTPQPPRTGPLRLNWIRAERFRNLDHLELRLPGTGVEARVIQGPNGTGKSSLFEAVSLALCGASSRYLEFLGDADSLRPHEAAYRDTCLRSVAAPHGAAPRLDWSAGSRTGSLALAPAKAAAECLRTVDGTLLAQQQARSFVAMSGEALGAMALGTYSGLAHRANTWLNEQLAQSREQKNAILTKWGLSTQITRRDTANERVVGQLIARELGPEPTALDWLRRLSTGSDLGESAGPPTLAAPLLQSIADLTSGWAELNARQPTVAALVEKAVDHSLPDAVDALQRHLGQRDRLLAEMGAICYWLDTLAAPLSRELLDQCECWGHWLEQQQAHPAAASSRDLSARQAGRAALTQTLARTRAHGEALKAHAEHLCAVAGFVARHWPAAKADQCPTCGSDTRAGFGEDLATRMRILTQTTNAALAAARVQYRQQTEMLKTLDAGLQACGAAPCPVATERQVQIAEALGPWLPHATAPESWLGEPGRRARLLATLERLLGRPAAPQSPAVPARERAARCCCDIAQTLTEIDAALRRSAAWDALRKRVQQALAEVTDRHLPDSIGRVWVELAMSLTPARWQLPATPAFKAAAVRGKPRLSVQLAGRRARHLLNQAEAHTLGLAWFLLRYLSVGRFQYALLGLDDPASDLDQPAFRDLCRLLAMLLRLHRVKGRPLDLLLFLHQDERAFDAVRATGATLHRLGWNRGLSDWLRVVRLWSEPPVFPTPSEVLTGEHRRTATAPD